MKKMWTEDEIADLRRLYPTTSYEVLETYFGRSYNSITHKANRLHIQRDIPNWLTPVEPLHLEGFDLGFVIGIIEGEGTITYHSHKGRLSPSVQVVNTQWELLEITKRSLNNWGTIYDHCAAENRQQCWTYKIFKIVEVEEILRVLEPHLISKRIQAKLVLEAIDLTKSMRRHAVLNEDGHVIGTRMEDPHKDRRYSIYDEIRKLNTRGKLTDQN